MNDAERKFRREIEAILRSETSIGAERLRGMDAMQCAAWLETRSTIREDLFSTANKLPIAKVKILPNENCESKKNKSKSRILAEELNIMLAAYGKGPSK